MRKYHFFFFFFIMALQSMAANFAHPITPTIIYDLGLESYSFGLFFAGMAFTNFLFSPFWANQIKRRGSAKVLGVCCVGYAIGQAMFGVFTTIETIFLARVFSGLFVSGIMVSYLTYVIHKADISQRGRLLALSATFTSVFGAFGYLIGGVVGVYSIPITFVLQSGVLALCGLLFYFTLADDRVSETNTLSIKSMNPFSAFIQAKQYINVLFVALFACVFISSVATTCFDQSFNYYIKDVFQFSSVYNGTLKAVVGFISLIANTTICVYLIRRTNQVNSAIVLFLGCAFTLFSILWISQLVLFMGIVLIFFACNAMYIPIVQNICVEQAKGSDSTAIMGLYNAMKSLGMIGGALVAGFVYDVNNTLPFSLSSIFFIIAILCLLYYKVLLRRKS